MGKTREIEYCLIGYRLGRCEKFAPLLTEWNPNKNGKVVFLDSQLCAENDLQSLFASIPQKIALIYLSSDYFFSSYEELVEKCDYYLQKDYLREKIGNNLREVVREKFTYEALVPEMLERFRTIIRGGVNCMH